MERWAFFYDDPNLLAFVAALTLAVGFSLREVRWSWLCAAVGGSASFFGYLTILGTGSRGGLITAVVLFARHIHRNPANIRHQGFRRLEMTLVFLGSLFVLYDRSFVSQTVVQSTATRISLWSLGAALAYIYPLGIGREAAADLIALFVTPLGSGQQNHDFLNGPITISVTYGVAASLIVHLALGILAIDPGNAARHPRGYRSAWWATVSSAAIANFVFNLFSYESNCATLAAFILLAVLKQSFPASRAPRTRTGWMVCAVVGAHLLVLGVGFIIQLESPLQGRPQLFRGTYSLGNPKSTGIAGTLLLRSPQDPVEKAIARNLGANPAIHHLTIASADRIPFPIANPYLLISGSLVATVQDHEVLADYDGTWILLFPRGPCHSKAWAQRSVVCYLDPGDPDRTNAEWRANLPASRTIYPPARVGASYEADSFRTLPLVRN